MVAGAAVAYGCGAARVIDGDGAPDALALRLTRSAVGDDGLLITPVNGPRIITLGCIERSTIPSSNGVALRLGVSLYRVDRGYAKSKLTTRAPRVTG